MCDLAQIIGFIHLRVAGSTIAFTIIGGGAQVMYEGGT
jgi:hypothetical protein